MITSTRLLPARQSWGCLFALFEEREVLLVVENVEMTLGFFRVSVRLIVHFACVVVVLVQCDGRLAHMRKYHPEVLGLDHLPEGLPVAYFPLDNHAWIFKEGEGLIMRSEIIGYRLNHSFDCFLVKLDKTVTGLDPTVHDS